MIKVDYQLKKSRMKNYLVVVNSLVPYPVGRKYREEAMSMVPAVSRAIKKYRKELKAKKIEELNIRVVVL